MLLAGRAYAQTEFVSKVQLYIDNDHTEVVSPLVRAQADVTPTLNVSAGYVADIVTSASIDIVSQASKTTIHDVRHQGTLGLAKTLDEWTVHGAYIYSTENDYASNNGSFGFERRLFDNNTQIDGGFSFSINDVQRSGDHNFHKALNVYSLGLSATQVLTPNLVGQLSYEFGAAEGFQASPYRFVPIRDEMGVATAWVPETDPDERLKHAFVGGLNLHVFEDSSIQADYRIYRDTWDITSHTIQVRYLVNLTPNVELRLRNRLYTQTAASFYSSNYTAPQKYMAIDRELSPFWSELFGTKISWKISPTIETEAKVDVFYFAYSDFPLLPSRSGANVETGLSITY